MWTEGSENWWNVEQKRKALTATDDIEAILSELQSFFTQGPLAEELPSTKWNVAQSPLAPRLWLLRHVLIGENVCTKAFNRVKIEPDNLLEEKIQWKTEKMTIENHW